MSRYFDISLMTYRVKLLGSALAASLVLGACNDAQFNAETRKNAEPAPPDAPPPPPPENPPRCTDQLERLGAHVAFLIDNSNSNAATDCPGSVRLSQGNEAWECRQATSREVATLAAFDTVLAAGGASNAVDARSRVSVAGFPVSNINGNPQLDWIDVAPGDARDQLAAGLRFTRRPGGLTPYGEAVDAATELFSGLENDGRGRVAVLVTDGEPTDRDPAEVAAKAQELTKMGVELITVFVTSGETRAAREARHIEMLRNFNQSSLSNGQGPWYTDRYPTFDSWTADLLGRGGSQGGSLGLIRQISSKVDPSCQDATGSRCERRMIEVGQASALKSTFEQIIRSRVIGCVP
jgi:hypothetical protein